MGKLRLKEALNNLPAAPCPHEGERWEVENGGGMETFRKGGGQRVGERGERQKN